jgi:hypothetical protein
VGAVACAAGLSALALLDASETVLDVGVRLCVVSLLALVAALVLAWPSLVPGALVLLGAAYATQLAVDDAPLDARAPLFAAGLLVTAELAYWSLEEREDVQADPGDALRRAGFVALLALGMLAVGAALLAVTDAMRAGGLAVDLLGAAAAAAVLVVVVLAARRPGSFRQ